MWNAISLVLGIWTRVAVSISYEGNHYTTGTSKGVNNKTISLQPTLLCYFYCLFLLLTCFGILPVENKTKSISAEQGKIRLTVARDVTREKEQDNNLVEKKVYI